MSTAKGSLWWSLLFGELTDLERVGLQFIREPSYRGAIALLVEIAKQGGDASEIVDLDFANTSHCLS